MCLSDAINFVIDNKRGLLKPIIDKKKCVLCKKCLSVCPGYTIDFEGLTPNNFEGIYNKYLGYSMSAFVGYSLNKEILYNSSSGGLLTEYLIQLIENNIVSGIITVQNTNGEKFGFETFIARNRKEIIDAQKSKYYPIPSCSIFKNIIKESGTFAFVGLPCQIAGLRKIQQNTSELKTKIPFLISLFCSRMPNANATNYLVHKLGLPIKNVKNIEYRGSGHPGKFHVTMNDSTEHYLNHLDSNYWGYNFMKFFKPVRCWLCPDHSGILSDISFADNWTQYARHKDGSTMILCRTHNAEQIVKKLKTEKKIYLSEIKISDVVNSQDIEYKANVIPRMKIWRFFLGINPKYVNLYDTQKSIKKNEIFNALPEFFRVILSSVSGNYIYLNVLILINKGIEIFAMKILKRKWR